MGKYYLLEKIQKENDIKKILPEERLELARQIRAFLIEKLSKTGGHLASNLGCVELTMALHLCLDLPKDKIIWDVGHQSYIHKILTGRWTGFDRIRQYGGMSGFPKRKESDSDAFDTGHSSTSISAGLGYAVAAGLRGEDNYVVSVIGDGALTGGMAYEALNNASGLKRNYIIILNDNEMSISPNVGGISAYLSHLRTDNTYMQLKGKVSDYLEQIPYIGSGIVDKIKKGKSSLKQLVIPGMFFENMGIVYLGPIDGHNLNEVMEGIEQAKRLSQPVLLHVVTKKGKGYLPAEEKPEAYHGTGPFTIKDGMHKSQSVVDYSKIFGDTLLELAKEDENIVAITAAMPTGTGLIDFAKYFPHRLFDVGIAEAHGVTFSAGLAAAGMKPYMAVYSSFLQRGYDQLIHDVCIQNLPVTFCVDRAGLVGSDGETHQGIFDISYLSMMPNMTVMAPKNGKELRQMLIYSKDFWEGPLSIRYPRGQAQKVLEEFMTPIEYGRAEVLYEEEDILLLCVGTMTQTGDKVRKKLKEIGYNASLVNLRFIKPIDEACIVSMARSHSHIVVLEENIATGGVYQRVLDILEQRDIGVKVIGIHLGDSYIEHGDVQVLQEVAGIDVESITSRIVHSYLGML